MSLYLRTLGDGPDLLLIHGWGMHGGIWQGVTAALAQRFRLHVPDLPGMGYSSAQAYASLAELSALLLPQLPQRFHLCGWSLGGQVALDLALRDAARVERLALVGTTPRFVSAADWPHGVDVALFQQFARDVSDHYQETLSRFLSLQAMGGEATREQARQLRARFAERPAPDVAALRQGLRLLLGNDLRASLAGIGQPSLVLHGANDTLAPVAAARWMAEALPAARLEVIAGAGHAPFLSHPSRFAHLVTQFLES